MLTKFWERPTFNSLNEVETFLLRLKKFVIALIVMTSFLSVAVFIWRILETFLVSNRTFNNVIGGTVDDITLAHLNALSIAANAFLYIFIIVGVLTLPLLTLIIIQIKNYNLATRRENSLMLYAGLTFILTIFTSIALLFEMRKEIKAFKKAQENLDLKTIFIKK